MRIVLKIIYYYNYYDCNFEWRQWNIFYERFTNRTNAFREKHVLVKLIASSPHSESQINGARNRIIKLYI